MIPVSPSRVVPVRLCVKVTRESSGRDLPTSRALTGFTRQNSPEPMEGQSSPPRSTEMLLSRESLHILEEGLPVEEEQKRVSKHVPRLNQSIAPLSLINGTGCVVMLGQALSLTS